MDSWKRFLGQVSGVIQEFMDQGCPMPFYRGHGLADWPLIPSMGRSTVPNHDLQYCESVLYADFLGYAGQLLPRQSSSWEVLFLMQHHGIPTRLLDWTETFSVALYFAIQQWDAANRERRNRRHQLPAIWMLNPYALNKKKMGKEELPMAEELEVDYKEVFVDVYPEKVLLKKGGEVIALGPIKASSRQSSQRSTFTFHASLDQPLEVVAPTAVYKIVVPRSAIFNARQFLELAGMNEFSVFPDLDGLGRYLKAVYKIGAAIDPVTSIRKTLGKRSGRRML